jgi:hypothetical protein
MAAAVIEVPNGVEFGKKSLDCINAIFELEAHVVIGPVALFAIPVTILKKGIKGESAIGCLIAVPFIFIADSASACSGRFSDQNSFIFCISIRLSFNPNPNSRICNAEIMMSFPSSFGIIACSPLGPLQADKVKINCQIMHSSWPKDSSGFSSGLFWMLKLPPN